MATFTSEDKTSIQVVMPKEAKAFLEEVARKRSTPQKKVYISDLVRDALKATYNGDISFEVDRGGDRRTDKAN